MISARDARAFEKTTAKTKMKTMTDKDIVKILHLILYWPDNKGHWTAFAILAMFDITLLTREGIWFLWTGDFQHILQGLDLGLIW